MTTRVDLLHTGYTSPNVASTVVLVRDADARIVVDPGMVADRSLILEPLATLGLDATDVTHVFLSHHHPDHAMNVALFPNAEVVDFWARYIGDRWLDHEGDGHRLSPRARLILVPGHTEEDAALIVDADDARYAMTHAWWRPDGPVVDPLAWDQARLERSRERILEVADVIVPGHGAPFPAAEAPGRGR